MSVIDDINNLIERLDEEDYVVSPQQVIVHPVDAPLVRDILEDDPTDVKTMITSSYLARKGVDLLEGD